MPIKLYNSLTRKTEDLKPLKKVVGLYTCGPTVYAYAHIGNLRTFVFEDILKRALIYNDYKVKHIMNITDVGHLTSDADTGEDKMEKGAAREGKSAWEIAKFYEGKFKEDLENLNILKATKYPRATDHIKEQINLIKKLEQKGFTYQTADGVYFDTSKLPDYGKLANLKNQSLEAGARVAMGEKKSPTDFALWKLSPLSPLLQGEGRVRSRRQMEWPSPWGVGFPGWHIECSAMSVKYLGQPFDIHCGGIDHIPVHHTNEIAQSEAAEGKSLANVWMHGEFLIITNKSDEAAKMSKSGDNFITLQTLKTLNFSPLAYRYLLLQTHYRKQLTFSWDALQAAQNGLQHLYNLARELATKPLSDSLLCGGERSVEPSPPQRRGQGEVSLTQQFLSLINTDLDTPAALALVWDSLNNKTIPLKTLLKFDEVLGLEIKKNLKVKVEKIPAEIKKLVESRELARKNKNWAESDRLRLELDKLGFLVEDSKDGAKVNKKSL
ncbi:MAG: cysteine--tRNA ligase [Patescibacteria group bacterium]